MKRLWWVMTNWMDVEQAMIGYHLTFTQNWIILVSPTAGNRNNHRTACGTRFSTLHHMVSIAGSILYSWLKLHNTQASSGSPYWRRVVTTGFCKTWNNDQRLISTWMSIRKAVMWELHGLKWSSLLEIICDWWRYRTMCFLVQQV